jgi:hypothetical protein
VSVLQQSFSCSKRSYRENHWSSNPNKVAVKHPDKFSTCYGSIWRACGTDTLLHKLSYWSVSFTLAARTAPRPIDSLQRDDVWYLWNPPSSVLNCNIRSGNFQPWEKVKKKKSRSVLGMCVCVKARFSFIDTQTFYQEQTSNQSTLWHLEYSSFQ